MLVLPIDPLIPTLTAALRSSPNLVLEAPPGAGKTTRVPPALLDAGFGEVYVLEPRRIAARMAARRVAEERGEALGETVGYQVRFEQVAGPRTRLRFVTEGVLMRRLLSDPKLHGVGAVVLDEFHERHLDGDVALALLRRLQQNARPDLRLVVMSATLHGQQIAEFLGACPVLRSEGRLFPIDMAWTPHSADTLDRQVAGAVERLLTTDGDILCFLPGAAEIRQAQRALEPLARSASLLILPLHGDLSPEEQDRAVATAAQRKVILSTNVAESSITIEGVRAVIDSGLARVAKDSPWTGLATVEIARVSRASATQRAGRAGRIAPGRVIRLYSAEDFHRRPKYDTPEIERRELSQLCLDLHACGVPDPRTLRWLDAPPAQALDAAETLLQSLGAITAKGSLTASGRAMSRLPLHPRLARLFVAADEFGCGEEGCRAAAVLSSGIRVPNTVERHGPSDIFVLMEGAQDRRTRQTFEQIRKLARPRTSGAGDTALQKAVLAAFPDRVARRRGGNTLLLANGSGAVLSPQSAVDRAEFLVALDIEDRPEKGQPLVRIASAIEPGWLLDLFPQRIREQAGVEWNREAERVEARSALLFDSLVIEQSRHGSPDPKEAARLLAVKALEAGLERFTDPDEWRGFLARLRFAAQHSPLSPPGDEEIRAALEDLCHGLRSFNELKAAASGDGLERSLLRRLGSAAKLDEVAPERIRLPGGRSVKVNYAEGQPPWVASRLQDFFGMAETPRIGHGAVPLVVHLLAPSQRPVQTTSDLSGFWQRLYPQLRRELSRKYPKHRWPEDPLQAGR